MWLDRIFIEFLVIFGINLFLNITAALSIIKDNRLAVKAAGRPCSLAGQTASQLPYVSVWTIASYNLKNEYQLYKRLYRLHLNKQLWRAFWLNQQVENKKVEYFLKSATTSPGIDLELGLSDQ